MSLILLIASLLLEEEEVGEDKLCELAARPPAESDGDGLLEVQGSNSG